MSHSSLLTYLVGISILSGCVVAQPPQTSGEATSTSCGSATTCVKGSYYVSRSLTYSTTTGKFTGTITTNQCPSHLTDYLYNGTAGTQPLPKLSCITQTFPAPAFTNTPIAAPLRGRVGLAIHGGENLYGPMDNGFAVGIICDNVVGQCPAGTDVMLCQATIEAQCGTKHMKTIMGDCGGHASPFHYHCHLSCDFDATIVGPHSPLVAVMFDGRGLYGSLEGNGMKPTDLDACGGHTGPVPETTVGTDVYPSASSVYHYHVQTEPPFLLGCFGPVTSLSQAKALYPSCTATTPCTSISDCSAGKKYTACSSLGNATDYVLDCPVYHHMPSGEKANQIIPSAQCPVCEGNCATGSDKGVTIIVAPSPPPSPSPSNSVAVSGTPSTTSTTSVSGTPSPSSASGTPSPTSSTSAMTTVAGASASPSSATNAPGSSASSSASVMASSSSSSSPPPGTTAETSVAVVTLELILRPATPSERFLNSTIAFTIRTALVEAMQLDDDRYAQMKSVMHGPTGVITHISTSDPINAVHTNTSSSGQQQHRRSIRRVLSLVSSDSTTIVIELSLPAGSSEACRNALLAAANAFGTSSFSGTIANAWAADLNVTAQPFSSAASAIASSGTGSAAAAAAADPSLSAGGVFGVVIGVLLCIAGISFFIAKQAGVSLASLTSKASSKKNVLSSSSKGSDDVNVSSNPDNEKSGNKTSSNNSSSNNGNSKNMSEMKINKFVRQTSNHNNTIYNFNNNSTGGRMTANPMPTGGETS